MKLYSINTGYFKLDGGAMFGVVPKSIWNKTNPADSNNMINLGLRALLIEDGKKLILIDNGMGTKQDAKFFGHYYLHGDDTLEKSLAKHGFTPDDITDVFLSHLHFDHCGGSVKWKHPPAPQRGESRSVYSKDDFELTFKNATYWSNEQHWEWATKPNVRERASFLRENILPIKESGHLKFIAPPSADNELASLSFGEGWGGALFSRGHTDAMMHPHIKYKGKTIVYVADLIPTTGHIPIPYVMGYDTRPLITMDEKEKFLKKAVAEDYILFFEHDSVNECCTLQQTEKGVRLKEMFKLDEY
ncbi:MAG: MBL fold metallo-hydrolase [Bacteroidetes bacterium]|nr:MBL fold metallo-hydrolase [Bacteroidota bacterium]